MEEEFVERHVNVLDFPHVRAGLILLYSIVFSASFFGNLGVLVVITLHKKMRNAKNFMLGQLAAANICVALFSVYQSLCISLVRRWTLGAFCCKMFHLVISLSHAASVLTLVLTAIERYVVIIYPIRNRSFLTMRRKRLAIVIVWMLSALLSFHKFYYATLIQHHMGPSNVELICTIEISSLNQKIADMLSLVFLFVIPLAVIGSLYVRIAIFLRERRAGVSFLIQFKQPFSGRIDESHIICAIRAPSVVASSLRARNKSNRHVVKMLTIVAVTFLLSNLPFHLRKILQNYSDYYKSIKNPWMELVAPLTFIFKYANCAVSPFAYAVLSKDFQRSLVEVVRRCRKN